MDRFDGKQPVRLAWPRHPAAGHGERLLRAAAAALFAAVKRRFVAIATGQAHTSMSRTA